MKNIMRLKIPDANEVRYEWLSRTQEVMVFRIKGKIFACNAICPHMGGRLTVDFRRGIVSCPWHGLKARLPDMTCDHHRYHRLKPYNIKEVDGEVEIEG